MAVAIQSVLDLIHKGDLGAAYKLGTALCEKEPANCQAWFLVGIACGQLGKYEQSISSLQQAIVLRPDYADAHNFLGTTLLYKGELHQAADSYK